MSDQRVLRKASSPGTEEPVFRTSSSSSDNGHGIKYDRSRDQQNCSRTCGQESEMCEQDHYKDDDDDDDNGDYEVRVRERNMTTG